MQQLKKVVDNIKGGPGINPKSIERPDVEAALKEADRLDREAKQERRTAAAARKRERALAEKKSNECCGCGC